MWEVGRVVWIVYMLIQCCRIIVWTHKTDKTTMSTISLQEHYRLMKNKKRTYEYFPNYGYEPYWADVDWMLFTSTRKPNATTRKKGTTTAPLPQACGAECNHLFKTVKHVCGREISDTTLPKVECAKKGLKTWGWEKFLGCSGIPGPDYNSGFMTFPSYCAFLAVQCQYKFYQAKRIALVHVGKCDRLENVFKPLWEGWQPASRREYFLSSVSRAYPVTTKNDTVTSRFKKPK